MSEESTFFLPVKDNCHRGLITCNAEDSVASAAVIMRDRNISSIIACNQRGEPVGIMTDHDLRTKVVAGGLDPASTRVREIMRLPVISVHEDDNLFEALYRMSQNRIRRVGVVDGDNKLVGMINESDILRLQNRSPQTLLRTISEARTIDQLRAARDASEELIVYFCRAGARTRDLVQMLALFNDQIALQLIAVLLHDRFPGLPSGFAFLVLGSEGRREQTLTTDQDNAIIYSDDLSDRDREEVRGFSEALIGGLIEIGVPECPGGIMAKNPFWRRSLSDWQDAIDGWIDVPSGENILNFSMFSDMRTLWGDPSLEASLRAHVVRRAKENGIFLAHMAANVCTFVPPLKFFGGIKALKQGEHAGEIDLKKAGIFALSEGIKTLALEAGVLGGSTHDKLKSLEGRGILDPKQASDCGAAFNILSFLRLRSQVESVAAGKQPNNFIPLTDLSRVEVARLQIALEVVRSLEDILKSHFQVNRLSG